MVIFELDVDESLNRLEQNHEYVTLIKNSLAEKRSKYRKFANIIRLDFNALDRCCSNYEYTLLIDMYSFSEQLVKNFFYYMIDYEAHSNDSLNRFIDSKVPRKRFSPNVQYDEIEKMIRNQLLGGFKFILSNCKTEISMYDQMIQSRHKYAHRGHYSFSLNNFEEILGIQKYIYSELKMIIIDGCEYRLKFQSDYVDLKNAVQNAKISESNIKYKGNDLKRIKNMCKKFYSTHGTKVYDIEKLMKIAENIDLVSKMDLRSKNSSLQALDELKKSYLFVRTND
jgi:hypothetical protein